MIMKYSIDIPGRLLWQAFISIRLFSNDIFTYLRPAASAGLVGFTSKMCHTFSFAPSNEQNLIEIPNNP